MENPGFNVSDLNRVHARLCESWDGAECNCGHPPALTAPPRKDVFELFFESLAEIPVALARVFGVPFE